MGSAAKAEGKDQTNKQTNIVWQLEWGSPSAIENHVLWKGQIVCLDVSTEPMLRIGEEQLIGVGPVCE